MRVSLVFSVRYVLLGGTEEGEWETGMRGRKGGKEDQGGHEDREGSKVRREEGVEYEKQGSWVSYEGRLHTFWLLSTMVTRPFTAISKSRGVRL